MKKITLLIFSLFSFGFIYAQDFDYHLNQSWEDKPSMHSIHSRFDSSSAVGILDERKTEYRSEKDNIFIYESDHNIIKIKDDNGIEMFNKIYIPVSASAEVQAVRARVVLPSGKVIDMDASKIKEIEENDQKYKLFAMDGLEKGCEVEYAYTVKRNLSIFGTEVFQRGSLPYQQAKFLLVTPSFLKFDAKGYNGFMVSKDSIIGEQRVIAGYSNDINEMDDEKYAFTDPYLQRVEYKLSYNTSKSENVRLYTWKEFAKQSFSVYTNRTSKEEKAINNFAGAIKLPPGADEASSILAIEDYIKNNINIDKKLISADPGNIEFIVKNKAADDLGIIRLFAGVFDKFGINYQLVFPGTRSGFCIDEDIENWNRADNVLIYFPSTGKFISPLSDDLRYPYIPFDVAATRGLYLKGTVIGEFKTAIGSFGDIPMEPFSQHAQNLEADISFNKTLDTVLINCRQIFKGYGATGYRPIYNFLPREKQEEANKEIIKSITGTENISNIKIENTALTNYFDNKPLIIAADAKSADLIETAGDKILFKVGEVIGPQVQMYQQKPRQLPAELPFPHVLDRKIVIHIPDGYMVKNPNDINMDVEYKENGETTMGFVSSYTLNNNDITITVNETYRKIKYPLSEFENFKNVINASADFNKITLLLQKK